MDSPLLSISTFRPEHGEAVRALVSGIQREEFHIPITLDEQPDLFDIERVYRTHVAGTGCGELWVAQWAERVVGTVALFDLGQGQAALRKMFVAPDFRGAPHRTAQRLFDALLHHAQAVGVREIALGTTQAFHAAHRFYEKNGFVEIPRSALPASWPHNAVDVKFYRRVLAPTEA